MANYQKTEVRTLGVDMEIQRMVKYIEQDAWEKVQEIDLKSEEEFTLERNKVRHIAVNQIKENYDRLEKKITKFSTVELSRIAHRARLQFLAAEFEVLESIRVEAKERMRNIRCEENADAYRKVLTGLILQGLFKMLESDIILTFHEDDKDIIDDCLNKAVNVYKDKTNRNVNITTTEEYLPKQLIGGVILSNRSGCTYVDNTLDSRFHLVAENTESPVMPLFKNMLFGANPNRKFFD